jgi:hypothetical protein
MSARLFFGCLLALLAPSAARAQAYVGPETCQACHAEAYSLWKASPHARATASLTGRSAHDGRCLGCHSPQQDKGLTDVTCESCHGPGQAYAPAYVMKDSELARAVGLEDPGEKSCRVCHDASSPSLKPFDFKEKLKLIDHWSAERARRAAWRETRQWLEQGLGLGPSPARPLQARR